MNKKIYAGMISFGVAASFWACGSGEILKPDELTDRNALIIADLEAQDPTKLTEMVNLRVLDTLCPECLKGTASSSSRAIPFPRSSSSSRTPTLRSSSSQLVINSATSSSTPPVVYESSSSQNIGPVPVYSSSSSAGVTPGAGDPGSCAPEKPTVESGEKVTWVFTNGKDLPGNLLLSSDFTWTTSDGDPASATIGGYKGRTHSVTYATTGKHNASVSILVKTSGATYNIPCTPVQVNGAPITGCKCVAADKKPDISVGGAWTVTGCTSVGANITTYEWLGATGEGTSETQAFTKKNQMASPVVNVGNDDNTVVAVPCDTVVSVDANSPDYLFEVENKLPQDAIQVKNKGCMSIRGKWSNSGYHPTVSVLCSMQGATTDVSFVMTYGTKTYKEMSYQSWGFSNVGGAIGQLNDGDVAFDNICVEFTGAETVECKLQ